MTDVTTHVLDTAGGRPAAGIEVSLEARGADGRWTSLGGGVTDADGRATGLAGSGGAARGVHRLVFATGRRVDRAGRPAFFDEVVVTFRVAGEAHLHIPLLLSPYGYTVYRGS
ncbi:MAG TPA: hydroxyisourate hydrolase [Solirubrobacteraceae bacterium]|jgi:5-hydroxyisourate hydrolase|nr:hydroxyisourate hydrolase [Solirubrobacteraceae bacterium]